jgi:amino acid transporter
MDLAKSKSALSTPAEAASSADQFEYLAKNYQNMVGSVNITSGLMNAPALVILLALTLLLIKGTKESAAVNAIIVFVKVAIVLLFIVIGWKFINPANHNPYLIPEGTVGHEGFFKWGWGGVLGGAGARMEMPGCSLCMGNQAQVREGATVMSTSTRNFPNRLGKNALVYLGSAELASICSKLGRIPTKEEYMADMGVLSANGAEIYKYMNFDQIKDFSDAAKTVDA